MPYMDPSGIEMLCRPERLCTVADREYRRWTTWSSLGLGLLAVAMIVISGTVCIPQIVKASFPNDFSCQRKKSRGDDACIFPDGNSFLHRSSQNKIGSKVFCSRCSGRYQVLLSRRKLWNQETRQTLVSKT